MRGSIPNRCYLGLVHKTLKSMFDTVTFFSSLAIVKTVKSANEIAGNAADALKLEPFAYQIGLRVNKGMTVHTTSKS